MKPIIGVTMGDPAGIGPEVIIKSLKEISFSGDIRIIGSKRVFDFYSDKLDLPYLSDSIFYEIPFKENFTPADPNVKTAELSLKSLDKAIELVEQEEINALVTAPLSKIYIKHLIPEFTGHTEYLREKLNAVYSVMLGYSEIFKVALLTTHVPITSVPKYITEDRIYFTVNLLYRFLKEFEKIKEPRLCMFSFNPHGLEFTDGTEDTIKRALSLLRIEVEGPLPADSLYNLLDEFHAFIAVYHDQGMIPVKLLSKRKGVNITLGLPIIRTSPLHGTAFQIAGKGIAYPWSMMEAMKKAKELWKIKNTQ